MKYKGTTLAILLITSIMTTVLIGTVPVSAAPIDIFYDGTFSSGWTWQTDQNSDNQFDFWGRMQTGEGGRAHTPMNAAWCAYNGKRDGSLIFSETVPSLTVAGWSRTDLDTASPWLSDYWDESATEAHGGSYSFWCAGQGSQGGIANTILGTYDHDMDARLYRYIGDMTGYDSLRLEFWYWTQQHSSDKLQVIYYAGSWVSIGPQYTGNSGGWKKAEVAIPNTATYVGFRFWSDNSFNGKGAFVDDIKLYEQVRNRDAHMYDHNMDAKFYRDVDLNGYDNVELNYWYWLEGSSTDYLEVCYYVPGPGWTYIDKKTGNSGAVTPPIWVESTVSIPDTATKVGFRWLNNHHDSNREGAYVDSVTLSGEPTDTWRFDFGTPSSPVWSGYTQVTHDTAYNPTARYGWDNTFGIQSRDRGAPNNPLRDLVTYGWSRNFLVDLPNGDYKITVWLGDNEYPHDNICVYAEGLLKIDDLSTLRGEFDKRVFGVTVSDGQLNLRIDDDGGPDPNWVINCLHIDPGTAPAPLTEAYFDFGSGPVQSGYTGVTTSMYSESAGYGWRWSTVGGLGMRDRAALGDLRRDLVQTWASKTFDVDLVNGPYVVRLFMGDAYFDHDNIDVYANGVLMVNDLSFVEGNVVERVFGVVVTDNRLSLTFVDDGGSDINWVINGMIIYPGTPPTPHTNVGFDFGTASSPVESGWTRIDPGDLYHPSVGYGWTYYHWGLTSRDRGAPGNMLRDLVSSWADRSFDVDLVNGPYTVRLWLGDNMYPHDRIDVYANNELVVNDLSIQQGSFARLSFDVVITDGRLNLLFVDDGGSDANWVINGLIVQPGLLPSLVDEWKFDFGTASSPLESGFTRVTHNDIKLTTGSYGWLYSPVSGLSSRDRGGSDYLKRDLVQCWKPRQFVAKLANGDYVLKLMIGDYWYAHDDMDVYVEGQLRINNLDRSAGDVYTATVAPVTISDGTLNIEFVDDGGFDGNWVINAIHVYPVP
jgi:fibronectin type 3 domain-containing protein